MPAVTSPASSRNRKTAKTLYNADVQKPNGEKVEIKVAEDGKLVRVNTDDNKGENNNESENED